MSHIIIDGYNCIGVMHKDLQKARLDFVNILTNYKKIKGHDITVVFDGHKEGWHKETIFTQGGIRVVYTPIGVSADDAILRIISEERFHWIIVSNDRMIQKYSWSKGMVPITCETFLRNVNKSFGDYEEDEEEFIQTKRLSKRKKAIKRALSHL